MMLFLGMHSPLSLSLFPSLFPSLKSFLIYFHLQIHLSYSSTPLKSLCISYFLSTNLLPYLQLLVILSPLTFLLLKYHLPYSTTHLKSSLKSNLFANRPGDRAARTTRGSRTQLQGTQGCVVCSSAEEPSQRGRRFPEATG